MQRGRWIWNLRNKGENRRQNSVVRSNVIYRQKLFAYFQAAINGSCFRGAGNTIFKSPPSYAIQWFLFLRLLNETANTEIMLWPDIRCEQLYATALDNDSYRHMPVCTRCVYDCVARIVGGNHFPRHRVRKEGSCGARVERFDSNRHRCYIWRNERVQVVYL